jgi:hypothetical protein
MRIKLFTLRYSPTLGRLDDTPLQDFLRDKTVLECRERFFRVDGVPHLLGRSPAPMAVVKTARAR